MKNFFLNRIFLTLISFFIGATSVWGTTKYFESKQIQTPFTMSRLLQNNADKILDDFFEENVGFQGSFNKWFQTHFGNDLKLIQEPSFSLNHFQEIKLHEDSEFKIYEIDLKGQTPKEVKVDVKDQFVIISAQVEKKENTDHASRFYSSSFHRSFPVPPDVDGENFKMEQENQKIVIKFPKKKV